jgi:hypothetical protein
VQEASVTLNGNSVDADNASVFVLGFGPGITYYLMPSNIYFGFSALLTNAGFTTGEFVSDAEQGYGALLRVGKEHAIPNTNWNLSGGAQYHGAVLPDKNRGSYQSHAVNLALSASYN